MIELIYGVENPNRYNVFQYWFSLFIMDFMILIISTLFLFLLVKRIFFSNIEEKINKINKCLRLMIILGFILILPYLFIDIEYTTPIGLTLIFLFKIGFLLFIIGLGLLMVDIMDRRKKENLK